ncbi:MAG: FHA domain-containing protein [Candidatus Brocadiia bacterium]
MAASAFLRVVRGEDKGKGWELDAQQVYTLGRSRKANLRVSDATVSGTHASLECREGVWFVGDLGSTHGTRVNRQRILGEKALFDRDSVRIGKTLMEFREYEELPSDDLAEIDRGVNLPE